MNYADRVSVNLGLPAYRRDHLDTSVVVDGPTRPDSTQLIDQHQRTATDLRVSLTDQCNLRCTYCMPAEGLQWLDKASLMQRSEIKRLVDIAVNLLGIRSIRFTGGEPLLRQDLRDIIADTRLASKSLDISLTTNAIGLSSRIDDLVAAGLDRINVSLDSVDADTFTAITRRPFLGRVLDGIEQAHRVLPTDSSDPHRAPVKINAVLMPGVNDHQAADLTAWALDHHYQLRFIEQMPLDADHVWDRTTMLKAADIRAAIAQNFDLKPASIAREGAPAELYEVSKDGRHLGTLGIIASVTENFCAACTRTRLTSEGRVRNCLFSTSEFDLLGPLRKGASDDEIADLWRSAMWQKLPGHGVNQAGFEQPQRPMSAIGG